MILLIYPFNSCRVFRWVIAMPFAWSLLLWRPLGWLEILHLSRRPSWTHVRTHPPARPPADGAWGWTLVCAESPDGACRREVALSVVSPRPAEPRTNASMCVFVHTCGMRAPGQAQPWTRLWLDMERRPGMPGSLRGGQRQREAAALWDRWPWWLNERMHARTQIWFQHCTSAWERCRNPHVTDENTEARGHRTRAPFPFIRTLLSLTLSETHCGPSPTPARPMGKPRSRGDLNNVPGSSRAESTEIGIHPYNFQLDVHHPLHTFTLPSAVSSNVGLGRKTAEPLPLFYF